ncbi:MAG: MraY family glycosyltransferase [Ardenticatenia bacterium]|nr:MraY family glycosyltransferase [Ardenticatenia bacterium]
MATGNWLVIFTLALAVAVVGTPLMRQVAIHLGVLDRPAARKVHTTPMPLLGGVAIYAAVLVALMLYADRREVVQMAGILVGGTWVAFTGVWDDHTGLRASAKLLAQVVAAGVLLAAGVQVKLPVPGWLNIVLTVTWVVGITNAFNLLDNMDGLSSGVAAVAAAYFLLLAALSGQYLVGAFAAAVLGASLGFWVYNFNPARIFMGDAGSLLLGFLMAVLGIKLRFPTNVPWVTWMVPILVLGVPIFDTTLVVISRLRRGLNPLTTPGKDHLSHRLVQLGWTQREAVLLLYLVGCALGGIAIFVSVATVRAAYAIAAWTALAAGVAFVWLERHASPSPET